MRRFLVSAMLLLMAGSCATPPRPAPVTPRPVPVAVPSPTATPAPLASDWRDWPVAPGDWVYRQDSRGSIAYYGVVGTDALLTLRCDKAAVQVYLSKRDTGGTGAAVTVRTTSAVRALTTQPTGNGQPYVAVALGARDGLLDAIAFSRGRFVVEQAGQAPLVVPAWAEIGRVIEDCRG